MIKEFIALVIGASTVMTPQIQDTTTDVVIRAGEYDGKPGKRIYVESTYEMPYDIPLHKDERGYYIAEHDINVKLAKRINEYLTEYGANTKLQISNGKAEDLNAAGRIAREEDPTVYLSVHHNYVDNQNVSGYVWFVNPGDTESYKYAQVLDGVLEDNPGCIPSMGVREQDRYIGEMNMQPGEINLLFEGGFFSNTNKDLHAIMDNEHVDYVAHEIAIAIMDILDNIE